MSLFGRLAAALIALVVLTALAVGALTYRNVAAVLIPRALDRFDLQTELMASELRAAVQGVRGDVAGFRAAVALDGMIRANLAGGVDPVDGASFAQWRDRMAARYAAELAAKPIIAKFRVIGAADGGRELLRVDRDGPGGAIRVVPDAELQRKGDRPYVVETLKLPDGQIHVSPIELNQEHGIIETPHAPVLRAGMPLRGGGGAVFGALVINLDLRPIFDRARGARTSGSFILVNERGDFLVHPDRSREFAFEFGKVARVQQDFPGLEAILPEDRPTPRVLADRDGNRFGIAVETMRLAGGPRVSVINVVPQSVVEAALRPVRDASLLAGLGAALCAIALAVLMARSMSRPLAQMTAAVEQFQPDARQSVIAPVRAGGEIGVLARAFTRMSDQVVASTAELRRQADIFDIIMGSMTEMVMLFDAEARLIYANQAARTLLGVGADIGTTGWQRTFQVFQSDGAPAMPLEQRPIMRAIRGQAIDNQEMIYRLADGTTIDVFISGRPIRDESGRAKGAVMVVRDATQPKQIERQLRQSQKLDSIGQLTGGVAHDFNNILTVIVGTSELLADAAAGQPRLVAFAQTIDTAAERGASLTRQLLAFARRQPLQPARTDVNALVRDAATLLKPTLGEHIEIEVALETDAWPALIDPAQLSTALLNLAVNARDAMPDGGKLTLETGNVMLDAAYAAMHAEVTPGPYVMIAVSDTGGGIPDSIRDRVFEPFFTTKESGKGTGLGLSMVYGFVKQSGGHVKIYSEVGHGTSVKLYLPRNVDGSAAAKPTAAGEAPRGHETVLVVEDDAMVRAHVVALLRSLGYRTLEAGDGHQALAVVDSGAPFDLLFTDVIMPGGMNGRQLAEAVCQRRPGMRVLYTSGYTENAIVHHGRLDPGVALLNKPYRKTDLARKLREVLGS